MFESMLNRPEAPHGFISFLFKKYQQEFEADLEAHRLQFTKAKPVFDLDALCEQAKTRLAARIQAQAEFHLMQMRTMQSPLCNITNSIAYFNPADTSVSVKRPV